MTVLGLAHFVYGELIIATIGASLISISLIVYDVIRTIKRLR